jgi:hypothetical protein
MSMLERDYVLRMIQLLAIAIGRVIGLKRAGKLEEALEAVRLTADEIFGTMLTTLDAIDPQSAARLLYGREKIEAYALLTAEEASILDLMGDAAQAKNGQRRALSLYLEAVLLGEEVSEDTTTAIADLRSKVDEGRLPQRYRDALASLAERNVGS